MFNDIPSFVLVHLKLKIFINNLFFIKHFQKIYKIINLCCNLKLKKNILHIEIIIITNDK